MHHFGFAEAGVIGLLQGVTELFPVSSLGHSVLVPAVIGGQWARDLNVSAPESPYLAFIVGLHVATAIALIVYFRRDWVRIIGGLAVSIRDRRIDTPEGRLGWLLVAATIPVGLCGLLLEHTFRTTLGRPVPAAIFLTANGVILLGGERLRRRAAVVDAHAETTPLAVVPARPAAAAQGARHAVRHAGGNEGRATADDRAAGAAGAAGIASDRRLARLSLPTGVLVGSAQIAALLPGISRSGITMVSGLFRGLSHEDAARFSFLLATPVILAAGVLKVPDLLGPLGNGVRAQCLFGAVLSGLAAYVSVRFLSRWFETRTLTPFGAYCLFAGLACLLRFAL
jgi:undecaprenyl-diphosphatase